MDVSITHLSRVTESQQSWLWGLSQFPTHLFPSLLLDLGHSRDKHVPVSSPQGSRCFPFSPPSISPQMQSSWNSDLRTDRLLPC